jgi:16S rRNA (adenine1518-N6/adenine1519-N6)-dimethyltransferase
MHRARKRFGQHFLTDPALIDRIVDAVDPRPGDRVVEIGPGLGALTLPLVARLGKLTVIELDRDLAARWRGRAGIEVVEADVLRVDFRALDAVAVEASTGVPSAGGGPTADGASRRGLRIVGNLPYNISSPILFHLLEVADRVHDQHVMLQSEVVDRMVAAPSSAAYGRLSVMLQWRYGVERLFQVPPEAFDPPPRVDSAVACMRPRPMAAQDAALAAGLSDLVAVAFSQRRKLLRHTLGRWLADRAATAAFELPPFDLQRRAEEVPVDEYVALARAIERTEADVAVTPR